MDNQDKVSYGEGEIRYMVTISNLSQKNIQPAFKAGFFNFNLNSQH